MRPADHAISEILRRTLPEGGFSQAFPGEFNAEATAWAILALLASGRHSALTDSSCSRLACIQQADGSITVQGTETGHYPTSYAVLAWKKAGKFEHEVAKAVQFLEGARGLHNTSEKESIVGHDLSIHGWPWREGTHSWIEPTSLAVLALRAAGFADHARVREAVRMILNRQLPSGGWNYGNTAVFNRELLPRPENTGQALCALGRMVDYSELRKSVEYASGIWQEIRTPFSLVWCAFGLKAWDVRIGDICEKVGHVLNLQERYGPYSTALLAQLVLCCEIKGDFLGFVT
jgi:hypothetical protein